MQRLDYFINMSLAAIAGLSGCMAAMVTFAGLLVGLALDSTLDTRPAFTAICIVGSVPLGLIVMLFVAYRSAKTIEKRQYNK